MAARKKRSSARELSAGQAAYVLERLRRDRRVSQADVNRYLSEMKLEISDLESKLSRLRAAVGDVVSSSMERLTSVAAPGLKRGRKAGRKATRGRGRIAAAGAAAAAVAGAAVVRRRRRRAAVTEEQLASRKLQGRYLSLVRQFPAGKRAQFAKIAKDKGREAAIKEMSDQLKK